MGGLKVNVGELKVGVKKVEDRLTAVESKLGGIDNRIDNETFARKDLEVRVRKILPTLPRSTERALKDCDSLSRVLARCESGA